MSVCVMVVMSKVMCMPIKLGVRTYATYTNCQKFLCISEYQSRWNRVIESAVVSEQYQLYCNERSHLKQLYFRKKNFFRTLSCLEQLLPSNNYFLLLNIFSDQLPLDDKYFSAQMLLRMSYVFRISNYLNHVLFRNWQFFETPTFSEELF